tara:strand:- start:272 stop:577 length:306 start_codon:yes stop_codon:yes gene_type:complete
VSFAHKILAAWSFVVTTGFGVGVGFIGTDDDSVFELVDTVSVEDVAVLGLSLSEENNAARSSSDKEEPLDVEPSVDSSSSPPQTDSNIVVDINRNTRIARL